MHAGFVAEIHPFALIDQLLRSADPSWGGSARRTGVDEAIGTFALREEAEKWVLSADAPGLSDKDVTVEVEANNLLVRGARKADVPEGYRVLRKERRPLRFERRLKLSDRVDIEKIAAEVKDGVLRIDLPKQEAARPRIIEVRSG